MLIKILKVIGIVLLLAGVLAFLYPKPVVDYPGGGWLPGFDANGYLCGCIGYRTPLVVNRGPEKVWLQAKCYGVLYKCVDFPQSLWK